MTLPSETSEWSSWESGNPRFLAALVLGGIAGALGTGLFYLVARWTGHRLGWLCILTGILVGLGVRLASRRRGGWTYQILAMCLTYTSIVATHAPYIREALRQASIYDAASHSAAPGAKEPPNWETLNPGQRLLVFTVTCGIVFGLAVTAPFLADGSLLVLLFLAVALLLAWVVNQRRSEAPSGPLEMAIKHGPR